VIVNTHPYLRAYLAGIAVPTPLLLVIMTVFILARFVYDVPVPIEKAVAFPMAVIPNAWGLWNVVYVVLQHRKHYAIGLHGAFLPLLLVPAGLVMANLLDIDLLTPAIAAAGLPFVIVLYYIAWKYLVNFCNQLVGVG
jgi:hypothetical protein